MTAELKNANGDGPFDLYYCDMFALTLTIDELNGATKRSCQPLVLRDLHPHPRVMFLKALHKLLNDMQPDYSFFPNRLILQRSFPEIELAEAKAVLAPPNTEFLLNSMGISFEMEDYLLKADQKDAKVAFIMQRLNRLLSRAPFAKQKFQ